MLKIDSKTRTVINPRETMGQRIKRLREAADMTMDELGARCGVSKATVWNWENDASAENMHLQSFLKLIAALEVEWQYLVHGPLWELDNARATRGRNERAVR